MSLFLSKIENLPHFSLPIRIAIVYAAYFIMSGIYLPYMPVWLANRGLDVGQIALILTVPLLVRTIISPPLAYLLDRHVDNRTALILLALVSGGTFVLLYFGNTFAAIFAIFVILALTSNLFMPVLDGFALAAAQAFRLDYGRMRLWGSLAFIVATLGGALVIDQIGVNAILAVMAIAYWVSALAAFALPRSSTLPDSAAAAGGAPMDLSAVFRLLSRPGFLSVLLIASLIQSTHAVYYSFGTLNWQRLGLANNLIGLLWSLGVIAEIILFAWSRKIMSMTGPLRLLIMAAAAAMLRWGLMGLDPGVPLLLLAQLLHAMTFGAVHLAAMEFITREIPRKLATTAQSVYLAIASITMALATYMSGVLYEGYAGAAYIFMAVIGGGAAVILYVLRRAIRSGRLAI